MEYVLNHGMESSHRINNIQAKAEHTEQVKIENTEHLTGISTGDVVKLTGHDFASSPSIAGGVSIGMTDQNNNVITAKQGLTVQRVIQPDRVVLTGFGVTALAHGSEPKVGDYISIRRTFTIAKGRVGVY